MGGDEARDAAERRLRHQHRGFLSRSYDISGRSTISHPKPIDQTNGTPQLVVVQHFDETLKVRADQLT